MHFNTFISKYFHFANVILTMLSSMYHFWGVHNLYQANLAKLNIGEQGKVGMFFSFRFSFFIFRFSLLTLPQGVGGGGDLQVKKFATMSLHS